MSYTSRDGNNFNLIRMIAAFFVILSHATAIQGKGVDFVIKMTGQTHSGQMAVFIFTFLSGIFITKSIANSNVKEFIKKRVLRLYPELILCLFVILIIGSIFTTYGFKDYWLNKQTWQYFVVNLLEVYNEHFLPGVFENHPNSGMNGVLWYITFEIRIYLVWALLKSLGVFKEKTSTNIVLIILIMWCFVKSDTLPFIGSEGGLYGMIDFPQYTITFALGSLLYMNCKTLTLKFYHIIVVIYLMILFRHSTIAVWIWAAGYIVIGLWLGTNKLLLNIKIKDLSYGVFLYGWPMGQIVYEIMPNASALCAACVTFVFAMIAAFLSEKIIVLARGAIANKTKDI